VTCAAPVGLSGAGMQASSAADAPGASFCSMIWMRCVEDRLALEGLKAPTARVAGINGGASIPDRRTPCRGLWLISRASVVLRPCLPTYCCRSAVGYSVKRVQLYLDKTIRVNDVVLLELSKHACPPQKKVNMLVIAGASHASRSNFCPVILMLQLCVRRSTDFTSRAMHSCLRVSAYTQMLVFLISYSVFLKNIICF
jgi:hypothetical protein